MKLLCTYEFESSGRINMKTIGEMINLEYFQEEFNKYCEEKECDRICDSEVHVRCLLDYIFTHYIVATPIGKECDF